MQFDIKKNEQPNKHTYEQEAKDLAYKFTRLLYKEVGPFLRAVVLFGSAARKQQTKDSDIDLLVIIDDVSVQLQKPLVQAYRLIVAKTISKVSTRLHVISLRFSGFWEYMRIGDPVGINILRDGLALLDTGFFTPMQHLLARGMVRPSREAIWQYYTIAPKIMTNTSLLLQRGVYDMYWAVIDSGHAALMALGEIPPSPDHVAEMLESKLAKPGHVPKNMVHTMRLFYDLSKKVERRSLAITGKQFDVLQKQADEFVQTMKKFIEKTLHIPKQ